MSFQSSLRTLLVSSLVLAGCDPKPEPITDPGPPNQVRGSLLARYRTDTGDSAVPQNPPAPGLQAFALEEGVPRPLEVVLSEDGSFQIPEAPKGKYMLRLGREYLVTDARTVNLDTYTLGRREFRTASEQPPMIVSLSNLEPQDYTFRSWQAVSTNAGTSAYLYATESVAQGATSVSRHPVSYNQYGRQDNVLLDASAGDVLYVTASGVRDNAVFEYDAVNRFFVQSVSMDPANPTHLEGTFQVLPPKTLTIDWRRSGFEPYRTQVHPRATTSLPSFTLSAMPGGKDAWYRYAGDLMITFSSRAGPDGPLSFTYGNPHPSAWGEVLILIQSFMLDLKLPGTTTGDLYQLGLHDVRPLPEATQAPFAVRISPPRRLTVDGTDAQRSSTLGSLTPRIAWEAPQLGTPTAYRVLISRLTVEGTRTRAFTEAYLTTTDTSLQLPPDILQPGQTYVFIVTSHLTPGVDLATSLHKLSVVTDVASADAVSGLLTTPASLGAQGMSHTPPRASEPDALDFWERKTPRHWRAR
ncbi:hypothetical protein [Melittangium boletus]|uniref:Uncharacterized protein n=1 Tax=Melittangium boletus DSM 14713 TaxID=1294270 RepID=A0A250IGP8_9BACT|nr:hypothetical protein [Melittangium boletus]ATB30390.1 hypothetical protein MEBOL_003851 [Melittangium boletus DSM 14713]